MRQGGTRGILELGGESAFFEPSFVESGWAVLTNSQRADREGTR